MRATSFDVRLSRRAPGPLPGHRLVETRAGRFHLREAGQGGTPVLVANDAPNTLLHAGRLLDSLAARQRTVVFELLGTGRSVPHPGFDHSVTSHVDSVSELLTALRLPPALLVFPCVAGLLAAQLAATHPAQVAGLALVQTPTWPQLVSWSTRVDPRGLLRRPWLGQLFTALLRRRLVEGWYRASAAKQSRVALTALGLASARAGEAFPLASLFQQLVPPSAPAAPLTQPALVLWGLADRTHRSTDRRATLSLAVHTAFHEWEDAGHSPELEQPARFSALLTDWWAAQAHRASPPP